MTTDTDQTKLLCDSAHTEAINDLQNEIYEAHGTTIARVSATMIWSGDPERVRYFEENGDLISKQFLTLTLLLQGFLHQTARLRDCKSDDLYRLLSDFISSEKYNTIVLSEIARLDMPPALQS